MSSDAYMHIIDCMHHEMVIMGLLRPIEGRSLKPLPRPACPEGLEISWPSSTGFCVCIFFFRLPAGRQQVAAHTCEDIYIPIIFLASASSFSSSEMFFFETFAAGMVDGM